MTNEKMQKLDDCLSSKSVELNEDELEQVSGGCMSCMRKQEPTIKTIYKPTPTFPGPYIPITTKPTFDDIMICW
ncbi:MAG: hypothetical protein K2G36_04510 [Ruminococcus sp.]|nr:hypothetical protein [Ruminococcus sp.]